MDWKQQWMDEVLIKIPAGRCRRRMENELRDHLETQRCALIKAGRTESEAQEEALQAMGNPDELREEYWTAWRNSLAGRLEAFGNQWKTWGKGCLVMLGVHYLIGSVLGMLWRMAISLPADSLDPQVRLIRRTLGNLNNSWLRLWLPLTLALLAGAIYLAWKFRTSRRPVWQISVGLSFHWTFVTAFDVWWKSVDHHRTFLEEAARYLPYNAVYYSLTFTLCILLGVVFGHLSASGEKGVER